MKGRREKLSCETCGQAAIRNKSDDVVHADGSDCFIQCPFCGAEAFYQPDVDLCYHRWDDAGTWYPCRLGPKVGAPLRQVEGRTPGLENAAPTTAAKRSAQIIAEVERCREAQSAVAASLIARAETAAQLAQVRQLAGHLVPAGGGHGG